MLSRSNSYTLNSFCKYRYYKHHVHLKNSITELLSVCFQFLDSEFYCLKVGFENQEILNPIYQTPLQNVMENKYTNFTYKVIQETDCIYSYGNTWKISIQQCMYECYRNYTQLLNCMHQYLFYLCENNHTMLSLYYNTEQKKDILKQILAVIRKYLKFDCQNYGLLSDVTSKLNSIKATVDYQLREASFSLFNEVKKKFLQFSAKINNYLEIYHERVKRSCDLIHEIEEEINLNRLSFFNNNNRNLKQTYDSEKQDVQVSVGENFPLFKLQIQESKRTLIDLLERYYHQKIKATYKCLNCERSYEHNKLLKHINICQKKYEYDQLLEENLNEILPKLLDLNGIIPTLQNLYKQKIQAKKIKHPQPSPINQKKSKFYNKQLSKTTTQFPISKRNQFLDVGSDLDDQASHNTISKSKPIKKIQELSQTQLKDLIKIVQKISGISEDIKIARQSLNLIVYYKLRELKNTISKSYKNLNVQCPEAETLLNLLLARYNLLQSAKKNSIKARRSGINTDEEYISLQNVEIQGRYTEPQRQQKIHKKNGFETPYASEDEGSSISSQMFEQKHTGVRQFQIIRKIGKGSFATVYLVRKKATEQKYAMKKIRIQNYNQYYETSTLSENLENQQCVFSITDNPFVMKAFFSFTEDQYHYFVMQYCPNKDFQELLKKQKRLTESEAKLYLAEMVEAIDYLHQKYIIHRDLKPQNIMLDANWHLKLTDYGLSEAGMKNKKNSFEKISKNLSKFAQSSRKVKIALQQKKRGIIGSPFYMAPEVIRGEPATFISDWWSFGVIFFQTLVGIPPFLGKTRRQIQDSIMKNKIWPSMIQFGSGEEQISYQAKDLIQKLLVLDPKLRIGNDVKDIKSHQFFKGINWDHLLQMSPPELQCRYIHQKSDEQVEEDCLNEKQKQSDQQIQKNNSVRESQSGSNKSVFRQLLVRRDLLNNTTLIKYKTRQQLLEKIRDFANKLRNECQRQQRII